MIRLIFTYLGSIFILLAGLTACTKEYADISELDSQNVEAYIAENSLQFDEYNGTGIYYDVIEEGNGPELDFTKKIPLIYTIKALDGSFTSVDTFANRHADYFGYFRPDSLREVIKFSGINQGGSVRVILPSRFGFGKSGSGSIPGNSSLDYTVKAITADLLDEYEDGLINKYITTNNLGDFQKTSTGLYHKIIEPGTGTVDITAESVLKVEYTGKLLNGTVFDKTVTGATATLILGGLIDGWKEALPLIKEGGIIHILVPSHLAYGIASKNTIPPFSTLYFEIKVTEVID